MAAAENRTAAEENRRGTTAAEEDRSTTTAEVGNRTAAGEDRRDTTAVEESRRIRAMQDENAKKCSRQGYKNIAMHVAVIIIQ